MMIRNDENAFKGQGSSNGLVEKLISAWPVQAILGLLFMAFGIWFALVTGGTIVGSLATAFGGAFVLMSARTFINRRSKS